MLVQRKEDSMAEDTDTVHGRSLLSHVRFSKKMRPLLLVAMIVLSIIVVSLHAVGGMVLLETGLGGFSHSPIAYVAIGLFLVVTVFKLKHLVGDIHRKRKTEGERKD